MIGETGERKSAVATPDGKSRKKKKKEVQKERERAIVQAVARVFLSPPNKRCLRDLCLLPAGGPPTPS